MIVALFIAAPLIYLTNPPQPAPYADSGRRFTSMTACREAGALQALNNPAWRCEEQKGAL